MFTLGWYSLFLTIVEKVNCGMILVDILYSVLAFHFHAHYGLNTLRPRQDGLCFADNIFKLIFWSEKDEFWLKFH